MECILAEAVAVTDADAAECIAQSIIRESEKTYARASTAEAVGGR